MSQKLYLTRAAALGNGTREAGFCIGTESAGGIVAADGVDPVEIRNAMRNPELLTTEEPVQYSGPDSIVVPAATQPGNPAGEQERDGQPPDTSANAPWRAMPVAEVPGMNVDHAALLIENKLPTAGAVFDFGNQHKGLTSIKGIGKATESAIGLCIAKLIDPELARNSDPPGESDPA